MNGHGDTERRLSRMLGPGVPEVSCDDCFELLDAFVDHELAGGDTDGAFPGMRAHFAGCAACAEEHDALLELVRGAAGS